MPVDKNKNKNQSKLKLSLVFCLKMRGSANIFRYWAVILAKLILPATAEKVEN